MRNIFLPGRLVGKDCMVLDWLYIHVQTAADITCCGRIRDGNVRLTLAKCVGRARVRQRQVGQNYRTAM
jgi:hypothetical protein